jgi:UDP-3-O-[3-hydroxymyristoyl] glucosamine N-acyltransferase
MKSYSIQEINEVLKEKSLVQLTFSYCSWAIKAASETEISFIGNKKYEKIWANLRLVLL